MRFLLTALCALGSLACGPSKEVQEAARVLRALDALRDAPADDAATRAALLTKLDNEPAGFEPSIQAKEACSRAYHAFAEASALEVAVRKALASRAPTQEPLGPDGLEQLSRAESKLSESRAAMPECERARHALARKH